MVAGQPLRQVLLRSGHLGSGMDQLRQHRRPGLTRWDGLYGGA
jgi:hypothetical protein